MPKPQKIPPNQLKRIRRLEASMMNAMSSSDVARAKLALKDLKEILERYGHQARVLENYLRFYEVVLEAWDLAQAKQGLRYVRLQANERTRLHLEATALLAIAHLRERDLLAAQPLIAEVLRDDSAIKSEDQRRIFRAEVIERFDQEGAIAALAETYPEVAQEAEVHRDAVRLLREGATEDDLLEKIGSSTPKAVKDFILQVDEISKKMLPDAERLLLPSPKEVIRNKRAGSIIFGGIKRRLYLRICDEESEVYQSWLQNGLDAVLSTGYVTNMVFATLADLRVGLGALAVGISALVMKVGVRKFCDANQPGDLMGLRRRRPG